MTPETTTAAPRRGSFLETWRLFANGSLRVCVMALLALSIVVLPMVALGGRRIPFPVLVMIVLYFFPTTVWFLEAQVAERLVFINLIPQPVDPKWLVLAPMCALAFVAAAVGAVFGRSPAVSALTLLGCAWWAIGSTRWLRRASLWALLAWPLVFLAPIAARGAYRVGGWGAASAVAMVLGAGVLLFQPPAFLGGRRARKEGLAPIWRGSQQATSTAAPERWTWFASCVRFLLLCRSGTIGWRLVMFLLIVASTLMSLLPSSCLLPYMIFTSSAALAAVYQGETHEFLHTRPFTGGQRLVGGVFVPAFFALLPLAVMIPFINREWFNHGGLLTGLFKLPPLHASTLAYMRDVLGATFLPEKWPAEGLSPELWLRVRPLLYMDTLRVALFIIASLFLRTPLKFRTRDMRTRWVTLTLYLVTLISALRLSSNSSRPTSALPVPPWWFAALLAVAAIAHWIWTARTTDTASEGRR
jgi:hypothetical protein